MDMTSLKAEFRSDEMGTTAAGFAKSQLQNITGCDYG